MSLGRTIAGFLAPGLAVYFRGPKLWGQAALYGCVTLFLIYIVWMGYSAANIAFGLLISLHATGFVYYCNPLMAHESFRLRLAFTLLVLLAMGMLLYWPARNLIQQHLLTPLRLNGRVIVIQRFAPAQTVQRGDWVAYALNEDGTGANYHGGTVWLRNGIGFGPVLAIAGDNLTFSTNGFSVNGILHTNLPYMPISGGLVVQENHWFIWPNLDISGHGDVGETRISAAMLGLSDISETSFYGKPFHHWFWRKQTLP